MRCFSVYTIAVRSKSARRTTQPASAPFCHWRQSSPRSGSPIRFVRTRRFQIPATPNSDKGGHSTVKTDSPSGIIDKLEACCESRRDGALVAQHEVLGTEAHWTPSPGGTDRPSLPSGRPSGTRRRGGTLNPGLRPGLPANRRYATAPVVLPGLGERGFRDPRAPGSRRFAEPILIPLSGSAQTDSWASTNLRFIRDL
jgi:hypothetical protein